MNRSKTELAEVSKLHTEFKEKHEQALKKSEKTNAEHAQALERMTAERDRLQQKLDNFNEVRESDQRKIHELWEERKALQEEKDRLGIVVVELESEVNTNRINSETWREEVKRKSDQLDGLRVELINRDTQVACLKKDNDVMQVE